MRQFLIRLDDACPTMDVDKWQRMENILDHHNIKPMVGVIPHNEDPKQRIETEDRLFWDKVGRWQMKGWSIALHGYNHCYCSEGGLEGINPMWKRSEFSGLSLEEQKEKIKNGVTIFHEQGINPQYFFAPSHTFDDNTLTALREESDIRVISDTIGRYPYKKNEFWFIPQVFGHCIDVPICGIYTFCLHPNTMKDADFVKLDSFLTAHKNSFLSFNQINLTKYEKKKITDNFLSWLFFLYRKIKGLK